MKKRLGIFLISLLLTTYTFSQNTYPKLLNDSLIIITSKQLKATNLIFMEHKKLKLEVPMLYNQINDYKNIIVNYKKSENNYENHILVYKEYSNNIINEQAVKIHKLKKYNKILCVGFVSLSLITVVLYITN